MERIHRRTLQQASWTGEVRRQVLDSMGTQARGPWIEIGAGTGAVARELVVRAAGEPLLALDIDLEACRYGAREVPTARWHAADAHHLPLAADSCVAAFFHFVLMWVEDPLATLTDAARVVRRGGSVVALAEPDHAARLDYPDALVSLGALQTRALSAQGADVQLGRRLGRLFSEAGLVEIQVGLLGGEWKTSASREEVDLEWEMLRSDLLGSLSSSELDSYEAVDRRARARGERILFVPTFYAVGRVP